MEIFELNACRGHHVLLMVAVILIAENSTGIAAGELMVDTWSTDNFWTETVTADSTTNRMSSMNNESALVLIQQPDEAIVKPENIKEQFQRFINAYDIDLGGVSIDFDVGKGLSALVDRLGTTAHTTIYYVFNSVSILDLGYCDVAEQLSLAYGKNIIFWPCLQMKKTESYLPSYETISFAIKSLSQKFNWSEAIIFATGDGFALPLAVAANLHVPYRIKIGIDQLQGIHVMDKTGKVIIITSPLNSPETMAILEHLQTFNHSKILIIDITGAVLNNQNEFYRNLNTRHGKQELSKNLLVLTTLSDKFKRFLNKTFTNEYKRIYDESKLDEFNIDATDSGSNHSMVATSINGQATVHGKTIHWSKLNAGAVESRLIKLITSDNQTDSVESRIPANRNDDAIDPDQLFHRIQKFLNKSCGESCANVISSKLNCEKYFAMAKSFNSTDEMEFMCEYLVNMMASNQTNSDRPRLLSLKRKQHRRRRRWTTPAISPVADVMANALLNQNDEIVFGEYFALFDFVATTLVMDANNDDAHILNASNTYDFILLDFKLTTNAVNETVFVWRPFLILQQSQLNQQLFTTHPLLPGYHHWLLNNSIRFWNCGLICWIFAGVFCLLLICIVMASITGGIAIRNCLLKQRLSKGPNKIVLSAADFVFPIDARRVDEGIEAMLCCWLQQLQEFGGPEVDKPDLLKGSIGSLKNIGLNNTTVKNNSGSGSLAKHNAFIDRRARYNGDLVQLKEVPIGTSNELKSKAMDYLVMSHGLRHENINPLIGWLCDATRSALVFEHCSRGSLQDVLMMDEIKLDWSFRLSLLTDLVRGMKYLHSSPLRVHGSLSSRNCVVDARWVLKVTDYGLHQFYEAQGVQTPSKTAKQLLWTAPELLRNQKGLTKYGTQAGDVYSFGIIMQEVVVRGEPFCMLSLSADEIIAKIKKPPPLIRPNTSKGAAPPEAINIMRQCWAESPEMRPDFNSVYERFKTLNHGRKVNFVDTMFQMLEKYSNNLEELIRERTDQLDIERKKTEQLLNRMLPSTVAEKLKLGLVVDPEEFAEVTIYFSDIVGFTTIAAHCSPVQVVDLLNDLYTCFDATINAYNVYKVETIGDAYMVVSGLPVRSPDHAEQIATMALDLLHQSGRFKIKHLPEVPLQLRIGLHTGPCCAGVVGLTMPRYCLFGDTVNTASRMESYGSSWRIHLSEQTRDILEKAGRYHLEARGPIEIKGKGLMNTYWLLGKKGFDKTLPTPPPIGLDEKIFQIRAKAKSKTPCISTTHSSSQSSSLAGEQVDVKVEITPPNNADAASLLPNSYSLDSNTTMNLSINLSDYKTPGTSPQQRKLTELPHDNLLTPSNFGRFTPSPSSASSSKMFKKFEELMDLSLPYNHYRCLSPSESNLTQCNEGKYIYGITKQDSKPGSSRLLRRQFSLDKEDTQSNITTKSNLDVPFLHENRSTPSPTNLKSGRLHRQTSASVAQDLEKIEEIPLSPTSCLSNHKSDIHLSQIPGSEAGSPANNKIELSLTGDRIERREICLNVASLMQR